MPFAGSFDSDEPLWIRNTVRTTYAAIWRYSLSQFSVSASQNDPLVAYSPSDISGSPCALVVVVVAKPGEQQADDEDRGEPEAHQ